MTSPVSSTSNRARPGGAGGGFTLIEILLVLAIVGILTAVTLPSFVRSIKGNRMRAAVRTVVSAGRYARAIGVMQQSRMALEFDLSKSSVTVLRLDPAESDAGSEPEASSDAGEEQAPERPAGAGVVEVVRVLDGVTIESVEREAAGRDEGRVRILYRDNGRNEPYTVRLRDDDGQSVEIFVDALGGAETGQG